MSNQSNNSNNNNRSSNQSTTRDALKKKIESVGADSYSARRKNHSPTSPGGPIHGKNKEFKSTGKEPVRSIGKKAVSKAVPVVGKQAANAVFNKRGQDNGSKVVTSGAKNPLERNPFRNTSPKPPVSPQGNVSQNAPVAGKNPSKIGGITTPTSHHILEEEETEELLEEGEGAEESFLSSSSPDRKSRRSKRKKGTADGSFEGDLKTILKKALPIIIPLAVIAVAFFLFSLLILLNVDNFSALLGINSKTGGPTDEVEFDSQDKEEEAFYERVKEIYEEYKAKKWDFDPQLVGAVFFIMQTHNTKLTFADMTKEAVQEIVDAMFIITYDEFGNEIRVYDKATFIENLKKDIFPKHMPKTPEDQYDEIIDEIWEYLEDYKDLLEIAEKIEAGIGVCIQGTLQAAQIASMSPNDYIATLGPVAQRDYSRTGVFASVTLAQSILESGWGKSTLSLKYNNMFGIKCSTAWTGKCVNMGTNEEYSPGTISNITAAFRVYDSVDESFYDHSKFLMENSRYAAAGVFSARNGREQIAAIKRAGYATDSNYVSSITKLMDTYDLEKWDVTVNTNTSGDDCLGASSGGFDIRTTAPTASDVSFNLKRDNRGQCVWYAQARAIEAAQDLAKKGLITQVQANNVQNALLNVFANAGMWYAQAVNTGIFNGSTNIQDIKPGSIIVWSKPGGYGHVAFVENVDTEHNTVTITEGWATNTTSCPNSWSCVNFKSNVMSMDDYYNSFGPRYTGKYNFVGYVYALEPKIG